MASTISVEFCGEWYRVEDGEELTIGREADLTIDDVAAVARHGARASLDVHARDRMAIGCESRERAPRARRTG